MKRLLILLLICLLPLQVFAGVRAYQANEADQAGNQAASWQKENVSASMSADAAQLTDLLDEDDDGAAQDDESFSQTGASDETMLMPLLVFPDDPLALTHASRHDAVRQPPFLPLPGRPPRV
jgi:anionic cell wall polymer biosynthesis LytR-Cps2A-Psr (LCP) family protein